jgi:hypothetical protein
MSTIAAVVVRYDLMNDTYTATNTYNDIIQTPAAIASDGSVFVLTIAHYLYAFDNQMEFVKSIYLSGVTIIGGPAAGNGVVALSVTTGSMLIYDLKLNLVTSTYVSSAIATSPVINGNLISVIASSGISNPKVYTFNNAGMLANAPYTCSESGGIFIQPFEKNESTLSIFNDQVGIFYKIEPSLTAASIQIGDYKVTWNSDELKYSLTGTSSTVNPVASLKAAEDWLLLIANNIFYFYADGRQIFAVPISSVPSSGSYIITAGSETLSVRDIVILNNPSMQISYYDGTGKIRQTQQMARIAPPNIDQN